MYIFSIFHPITSNCSAIPLFLLMNMIYNIWDVFVLQRHATSLFCFLLDKPIIAFNAYISKHLTLHRNTPVNVVYDKVFFNYGNAYNPHSGIFTAPSAGLYIFTWTSLVNPKSIFDAEILINAKRKGLGNCNNEGSPGFGNCANTVPLVLKAGDKVNLRTTTANFLYKEWSSFKGWKV